MSQHPHNPNGDENSRVLELIYAIRGLAQALEDMHQDIRRQLEAEAEDREKEFERVKDLLTKNSQALSTIPVVTSDRLEGIIQKRVDAVLDETRRTLDDVRMKLWMVVGAPKGPEASGSGMTIKEGIPIPIEERVSGRVEIHRDGEIKFSGGFNAKKVATLWLVGKWILVSLAAGGGIAGLIKLLQGLGK